MTSLYLDSNLIIYLVERRDAGRERLVEKLAARDAGGFHLKVSELSRLECRVEPMRQRATALLAQYDRFFASPYIGILPFDRAVFEYATELRARTRLRTPDALHLAAAITGGCAEFWTQDHQLIGTTGVPIRVVSLLRDTS